MQEGLLCLLNCCPVPKVYDVKMLKDHLMCKMAARFTTTEILDFGFSVSENYKKRMIEFTLITEVNFFISMDLTPLEKPV